MSLGVLNNLNAVYAENNLNNTSSSLSKTLQQLSSGSKINSGADDAAGLSLVDGLQANSQALAQSQTNASEGVGLLQVADGALSQVTSLLNRAVTLATEASNGTLSGSQFTAANQEYKSILSEVDNIGTTTTYNGSAVFGNGTVNIYTGDSTAKGASVDALNVTTLSESALGNTGGKVSYSGGENVFLDLSSASKGNAQSTDALTSGDDSMTVKYMNADGTTGTSIITAKTDTVSGMIDAINNSGLGLTASFTTASAAGVASGSTTNGVTDTGIEIQGAIQTGNASAGTMQLSATTVVDSTTTSADTAFADGSGGTATISYAQTGGANLSGTGLTDAGSAQTALNDLNTAITDVAAQDGYIGAQINTLNSVSSVLSTQQENVVSAQNSVQATDYASATSDMSKYEILSQTGISALAQANSMQQEVTKLLQ
jgi:flagellin